MEKKVTGVTEVTLRQLLDSNDRNVHYLKLKARIARETAINIMDGDYSSVRVSTLEKLPALFPGVRLEVRFVIDV